MKYLFKKKPKELKEEFKIGAFDFLIDSENSVVEIFEHEIIDLTIKADANRFDELCEEDNFEFGFGLYLPEFYARGIPIDKSGQVTINKSNQLDSEVALYFMEHNDVEINLSFDRYWISISGWTQINEKRYPVSIKFKTI